MSVTTLFFDLDGTLYPGDNGIWDEIANRMEIYMHEVIGLPKENIPALRKEYYQVYGTTLRGLQELYSIDQDEYLMFVHDIPLEKYLKPDQRLRTIMRNITIEKWIFTNSDRAHAERVLKLLGLLDLFEGILDVTSMNYLNKPDPIVYQYALKLSGNPAPNSCAFFEDSPRNLRPAKELGFYTVLVGNNPFGPEVDFNIPSIYYVNQVIGKLNGEKENG